MGTLALGLKFTGLFKSLQFLLCIFNSKYWNYNIKEIKVGFLDLQNILLGAQNIGKNHLKILKDFFIFNMF